ncbi:MAG TPA: APC family permease [Gammaproteobacteria bacterium]|nr:APC family permease [Gammaproteobacteria bacterium]
MSRQCFRRTLGLLPATAINMTQMCGIGPFITIPIMVATMGGPQAMIGWIAGAVLAMADGLVWAELGAALPGAGGSYLYLREAFEHRTGKLMPFLFIWTAMLTIPLIMATGVIGLVQYLGFFFPHLGWWAQRAIGVGVTALVVLALYRRIESIRWITTGLWVIMLASVTLVIAACFSHFDPHLAFNFTGGGAGFLTGLGSGLIIAVYDYLGYYTSAYMGDELRDPGRVMPRSIVIAIVAIMALYLALNIGVLGVVPWQTVAHASSIGSLVLERTWGYTAAAIVTVLILVTAFASVFAGLLGGSRVPFYAARDQVFFKAFGHLHNRHDFPHVALLAMGAVTAVGSFFDLTEVINMLLAASVLVQSLAQIAALIVLRRRRPDLHRPYRQWLYPLPCVIAAVGWSFVYFSATSLSLLLSGIWIFAGIVAFLAWAKVNRAWPFGAIGVGSRGITGAAD